jgi:hypothetical protein
VKAAIASELAVAGSTKDERNARPESGLLSIKLGTLAIGHQELDFSPDQRRTWPYNVVIGYLAYQNTFCFFFA